MLVLPIRISIILTCRMTNILQLYPHCRLLNPTFQMHLILLQQQQPLQYHQKRIENTTTKFSTPVPPPVVAPLPVPPPVKTTAPAPPAPPPSAPPPSPELWSNHNNNGSRMNDDTLILVQVPPGVCAGQTLHVQAPGSNDLI